MDTTPQLGARSAGPSAWIQESFHKTQTTSVMEAEWLVAGDIEFLHHSWSRSTEPGEEAPILHSCPAIISSSTITLHTADTSLYLYLRGGQARTQHGGGNGLDNCADVQVAGPGQLHPSTAPAMCHPVITNITLSYCHTVILSYSTRAQHFYISTHIKIATSCNNSDPCCSRFSPRLLSWRLYSRPGLCINNWLGGEHTAAALRRG